MVTLEQVAGAWNFGQSIGEMMVDFKKDRCEEKIAELEALIARLEDHEKTLTNLKARIPSFWKDDKANTVITALNKTMSDVNKKMLTAKDLVATYKTAMQSMETSENTASNLLEDALGLLESVLN